MRISSRNENRNHPLSAPSRGRVFCIGGLAGRGRSKPGGPRVLPPTDHGGPDCELRGWANSLPKPSGSFPASAPCHSRVSPPETRLFLATLYGSSGPGRHTLQPQALGVKQKVIPRGAVEISGALHHANRPYPPFTRVVEIGDRRGSFKRERPFPRAPNCAAGPTPCAPRGAVCRKRLPREKTPRYFRASSCRVSDHFWGEFPRGFGNRLAICRPIGKGGPVERRE